MKNKMILKKKNVILYLTTGLAMLILFAYAWQLEVPVISDETITMANAAWFLGDDWSLMIAALGGYYYRYVQALLTIPFFSFFEDPQNVYRFSMLLNAVFQVSLIPVVFLICERHLRVNSPGKSTFLGVAVCFVPSAVLYIFYYRGDLLLYILPWYALLVILEIKKAVQEKKNSIRIIYSVILAFLCILGYASHTRGIVLLLAVLICIGIINICFKQKTVHWKSFLIAGILLGILEFLLSNYLKEALYSISGLNANAIETTDMGGFFNIFSWDALKSILMLCISWMYTLFLTSGGLVLVGIIVLCRLLIKNFWLKDGTLSIQEKIVIIFSGLVFVGFYAVGALHFKWNYLGLRTNELTRRVDSLLYDRYSICGTGEIIFLALYTLVLRKNWFLLKEKILTIVAAVGITFIWMWKILPIATKYTGYIYNSIIFNTFNTITDAANILSGEYFTAKSLLGLTFLGWMLFIVLIALVSVRYRKKTLILALIILCSNFGLVHVNFVKVRKASNDYVIEATNEVVTFMQELEDKISQEYLYILKGGLSGIKIQFYQSQLKKFKMFGEKQIDQVKTDNYFIISKSGNIELDYYERDFYLFKDFSYKNADYDMVYVKGDTLKCELENLGYEMIKYIPDEK